MSLFSLPHGLVTAVLLTASAATYATCSQWPEGMTFVGLTDQGWQSYGVFDSATGPEPLDLNTEARTPVMSANQQAVVYLDEAGRVRQMSQRDRNETLLTPSPDTGYAQPEWSQTDDLLYLVQLKEGKSVDTDILGLDPANGHLKPVITQRSAQFDPHSAGPWLYYGNVHCVLGCGQIIQEVWRYHTHSGVAEQITLLNAISRQPAVDDDHSWLYFSSNASGHYHIYRQSLDPENTSVAEPLTQGPVTDTSPAPVQDHLYFVRRQAQGSSLMCRDTSGQLHALNLPSGITDIRDLEIRQ